MGVVDTIMVGHVSATALAAVALGNLYTFGVSIFGLGVLISLDPIVAQALGAKDEVAVERGLQRGLLLSVILTIPTSIVLLTVDPVLTLVRQPAEVIPGRGRLRLPADSVGVAILRICRLQTDLTRAPPPYPAHCRHHCDRQPGQRVPQLFLDLRRISVSPSWACWDRHGRRWWADGS